MYLEAGNRFKRVLFVGIHPCHDCRKPAVRRWAIYGFPVGKKETKRRRCINCVSEANVLRQRRHSAARAMVAAAIKLRMLQHPENQYCVDCGAQATEYDHRDYNKPLDVDPVCHGCNIKRGPGIPLRA